MEISINCLTSHYLLYSKYRRKREKSSYVDTRIEIYILNLIRKNRIINSKQKMRILVLFIRIPFLSREY